MRKLENNKEDILFLKAIISTGKLIEATFSVKPVILINDSTSTEISGYVTKVFISNGMCRWTNQYGNEMKRININCITL